MIKVFRTFENQEKNMATIINLHMPRRLLPGSEAIDHATVGTKATAINNVKDSHKASV